MLKLCGGFPFQANAVLALDSEARITAKGRIILAWYERQISPLPGASLTGLFFCTYEFENGWRYVNLDRM